jgi:hypothetical protein
VHHGWLRCAWQVSGRLALSSTPSSELMVSGWPVPSAHELRG